jgi:hypothetical protein
MQELNHNKGLFKIPCQVKFRFPDADLAVLQNEFGAVGASFQLNQR